MYQCMLYLILLTADRLSLGFSFRPHSVLTTHEMLVLNTRRGYKGSSSSSMSSPLQNTDNMKSLSMIQKDLTSELRGGESTHNATWGVGNIVGSLWGSFGVIMILANSMKRIIPIALEPLLPSASTPLTQFQLAAYIAMCLWFAYVEGYKGFQLKFSPLVVSRSLTLKPGSSSFHHFLLGPFYSMGLFHATKRRQIISWSVSTGVICIVAAVKRLPYPWRNIIDAGVVVGLTWGSISIAIQWFKAIFLNKPPVMDPCLPEE